MSEEMDKFIEQSKKNKKTVQGRKNNLVVSIDKNGRITQFNKECEKLTGYDRDEVINKQLFDQLILGDYQSQWEKNFDNIRKNKQKDDFFLPMMSQDGEKIMVSWSSFPIRNAGDTVEDIVLVGDLIDSSNIEQLMPEQGEGEIIKKETIEETIPKDNRILFRIGDKRIVFRKTASKASEVTINKKKAYSKKEKKKQNAPVRSFKDKQREDELTEPFPGAMDKEINKTIKSLEKENAELKKQNNKLEKKLENLQKDHPQKKKKQLQPDRSQISIKRSTAEFFDKWVESLFTILGGKKKNEEFEEIQQELDKRKSQLDDIEAQLMSDKRDLNQRGNEFRKWREKLEILEEEIENRRKELLNQEKMFSEQCISSLNKSSLENNTFTMENKSSVQTISVNGEAVDHREMLDKISDSAFVIQRGILKQVNQPFMDMIGYSEEDIVNKNLLNFVVPEGFSDIEKYYLKRLKGKAISTFKTTFVTKNDKKIWVEVCLKPIVYNNEKADMAVIKILEDIHQENEK